MNREFPKFTGAPVTDQAKIDALWKPRRHQEEDRTELANHILAYRKTSAEKLAKIDAEAEIKFPKMRAELDAAMKKRAKLKSLGDRRPIALSVYRLASVPPAVCTASRYRGSKQN